MKECVVGFLFNETRDSVIPFSFPACQSGRSFFIRIGGHVEPGETPSEAMNRESIEEMGVVPVWTRFCRLTGEGFSVWFFKAFDTTLYENATRMTDETIHRCFAFNIHGLNVIPNLRWLIPMALSRGSEIHGPVDYYEIIEC